MQFNPYLITGQTYFIAALNERLAALRAEGRDIISLIMGDPIEPTWPPVREAVITALQATAVSQYPKNRGESFYLEAVSAWAERTLGQHFDPATEILSCNGTKEAIFHLPLLFDWSSGREMWIPSLSYPVYEAAARTLNVPLRTLPLSEVNGFLPDLDSLSPADWRQCQVFWINSPHNPTTAIASRSWYEKLLALAERYNFLVCSDECYNELYYTEAPPASCLEIDSPNSLVFRSLSKRSHMTGYRMGALLSRNRELIRLLGKLREPIGVGTPSFIQHGGATAWQDDAHPRVFAEGYRRKRDLISAALRAAGCRVFGAEAGFYLWFSHPDCLSSEQLVEAFIEAGLLITPGTAFGVDGEGYARMTYCVTQEVAEEVARRAARMRP
jgi:aspartate/methionine/tyrosine aminotransferase